MKICLEILNGNIKINPAAMKNFKRKQKLLTSMNNIKIGELKEAWNDNVLLLTLLANAAANMELNAINVIDSFDFKKKVKNNVK